jgi:integrase
MEPDMPEELRPLNQAWVMFHQKPTNKKLILWNEFWDIYADSKRLEMSNKNNQNKQKYWNSFLALVANQEVSTDTVDDGLREWLNKRTKDSIKDSTVSKEFRQIKAVLNLVDDRENLKLRFSPPKFEIHDAEKQKSVFNDKALLELWEFIADKTQRTYAPWKTFMLIIMCQSSAHQSEIEQLKRQDIHLDDDFPFINLATAGSKLKDNARKRLIPIPFKTNLLKELLAEMDDGQELCFPPSVMKTGKDNRQTQLSRIVSKFGDYQPYSLRHTFKHRLSLVAGAKLMQVQYLQGWSGVDKSQKERLANYGASVFTDRQKHPEVFEEMFNLVRRTMSILDQSA